jgi:hypothetical protein
MDEDGHWTQEVGLDSQNHKVEHSTHLYFSNCRDIETIIFKPTT